MAVEVGIKGTAEELVTEDKTAIKAGSGTLKVYGTPFMTALMENAAFTAIAPYLEDGQGSVGIRLEVSHIAATPVGMNVRAECEVTDVDGRNITFSVRAFDEKGLIGEGIHTRCVIGEEKFLGKCYAKLNK